MKIINSHKIILALLTIIFLTSCGKSDSEITEEINNIVKQNNENAIINLSKRYGAVSGWDTRNIFTYKYQEMFIDQGKPISFEGELFDITKTDSTYYLHVKHRIEDYYMAQISLSRTNFIEFEKKLLESKKRRSAGCFIFKVSQIIAESPKIELESEIDGEYSYSYFYYNFDETFLLFKGELIDFYFTKTE